MGRDVSLTVGQFMRLRGLVANSPSTTIGEDAILQPLFRKLTLTDVEKAESVYRERGDGFIEYKSDVLIKRHLNTQQVRALVSCIWRPPEGMPWRVMEFDIKKSLLEELGETVNLAEDEDD